MRDFEATPVVRYEGPRHLRKVLEMEARKFLGYVKGVMGGGNPYQKYRKQYPDGTIIEVQSINNIPGTPGVDIFNIFVPSSKAHQAKKAHEDNKKVTEELVPIMELWGSGSTIKTVPFLYSDGELYNIAIPVKFWLWHGLVSLAEIYDVNLDSVRIYETTTGNLYVYDKSGMSPTKKESREGELYKSETVEIIELPLISTGIVNLSVSLRHNVYDLLSTLEPPGDVFTGPYGYTVSTATVGQLHRIDGTETINSRDNESINYNFTDFGVPPFYPEDGKFTYSSDMYDIDTYSFGFYNSLTEEYTDIETADLEEGESYTFEIQSTSGLLGGPIYGITMDYTTTYTRPGNTWKIGTVLKSGWASCSVHNSIASLWGPPEAENYSDFTTWMACVGYQQWDLTRLWGDAAFSYYMGTAYYIICKTADYEFRYHLGTTSQAQDTAYQYYTISSARVYDYCGKPIFTGHVRDAVNNVRWYFYVYEQELIRSQDFPLTDNDFFGSIEELGLIQNSYLRMGIKRTIIETSTMP